MSFFKYSVPFLCGAAVIAVMSDSFAKAQPFCTLSAGTPEIQAYQALVCGGRDEAYRGTKAMIVVPEPSGTRAVPMSRSVVLDEDDQFAASTPRSNVSAATLSAASIALSEDEEDRPQQTPVRPSFVPQLAFAPRPDQTAAEIGFGRLDQLLDRRRDMKEQIENLRADRAEQQALMGEFLPELNQTLEGAEASLHRIDQEIAKLAQDQGITIQDLSPIEVVSPGTSIDAEDIILSSDAGEDEGTAPSVEEEGEEEVVGSGPAGDDADEDDAWDDDMVFDLDDGEEEIGGSTLTPAMVLARQQAEARALEEREDEDPCVGKDTPECTDLTGVGHGAV